MAFFLSLWAALKEILLAPFFGHRLWWQLAPVFILWIVLEVYFARHKGEELGWNTALGNAITLFWLAIAGMQQLFTLQVAERFSWSRLTMVALILAYSLFVAFISFGHKLGQRATYLLAYPTVIYYLALFAILWGNKVLAVNKYILLAFLLLWGLVVGFRLLLVWLLPDADESGSSF